MNPSFLAPRDNATVVLTPRKALSVDVEQVCNVTSQFVLQDMRQIVITGMVSRI
jgi:translation elongation factor EF-1alpha